MSEPWVDQLARQLDGTRTRRGVFRAVLGLLVGGAVVSPNRSSAAKAQIECEFGWQTFCTQQAGAEQCIDFSTDSDNCGYCGRVCPEGTGCIEGSCSGTVNGKPPAGVLSATALCVEGPRQWPGDELLEVAITNNLEHPVMVAHIGSMTGPAQPSFAPFAVSSGEAWRGYVPRTVPDGIAQPGAYVTTDAGAVVLPCGDADVPFDAEGYRPEAMVDTAGIMTRTLSILESRWSGSLDALYALLHPDVRELVTYGQLACWYMDDYLSQNSPAGEATVLDVQIAPWTWDGNGRTFENAAAVTYRQPFMVGDPVDGNPPPTEEREAVLHLVEGEGSIWRWFFGTDADWLAGLPEVC